MMVNYPLVISTDQFFSLTGFSPHLMLRSTSHPIYWRNFFCKDLLFQHELFSFASLSSSWFFLQPKFLPISIQPGRNPSPPPSGPKLDYIFYLAGFQEELLVFGEKDRKFALWIMGQQGWRSDEELFFPSGRVVGTCWQDRLILGGNKPFTPDEEVPNQGVHTGLTAFDGETMQPLSKAFQGVVADLAIWRGDLIVAGHFSIEGQPELTGLARWDGCQWHALKGQPLGGGQPRITCLTVHRDQLVAGGVFAAIGETAASNLAIFDGQTWATLDAGANQAVNCVSSFADDLFVSGRFTCLGGRDIKRLARWDGSRWHSMERPENEDSYFSSWSAGLLSTPEGLFVAGFWMNASPDRFDIISRWNGLAWDDQLPDLARTGTEEIVPRKPATKSIPYSERPMSQPRPWLTDSRLELKTIRGKKDLTAMAWYQGHFDLPRN